jgi:hypothetical protein
MEAGQKVDKRGRGEEEERSKKCNNKKMRERRRREKVPNRNESRQSRLTGRKSF